MQQMIRKSLGAGVHLTIVPSKKFKTSVMGACLVLPLGGENAAEMAVLPRVLRRATAEHPDMQSLGAALDLLFGARVEPFVRKRGESVLIGFSADVIDEKYATGGVNLTAQAASLLMSFWNNPYLPQGAFDTAFTQSERENLADRIEALKNDTRSYAVRRLHEEMCRTEAFGQSEFGTAAQARAITPQSLYKAYIQVMNHACMELFYCGSMPTEQVVDAFSGAVGTRTGETFCMPKTCVLEGSTQQPKTIIEEMPVTQGKLSLGFRTGITGDDPQYPALMLLSNAFGGSTSSRLFLHVREKMSLCYYASATLEKQKGIMTVASGIENENFDVAREEILRQLQDMQSGNITQEELETARRTVLSGLQSMQDSPISLQDFWFGQAVAGYTWDMETLAQRIWQVSLNDIIAAANCVTLDTIYFLKGVGA